MEGLSIQMWGVLLAITLIMGVWQLLENTKLKRTLRAILPYEHAQSLVHFAWIRTLQLLFVLICAALFLISYNTRLTKSQDTIAKLKAIISLKDASLQKQTVEITRLQSSPKPLPNTALETGTPTVPSIAVSASGPSVEDIYNPEKSHTDTQSGMDEIKKRYEDIFVIYMFLQKCGKINSEDYGIIINGLTHEMASLNAPPNLQSNIISAAQDAYKEVYAQSPCEGEGMDTLRSQYNNYITLLSTHFPIH